MLSDVKRWVVAGTSVAAVVAAALSLGGPATAQPQSTQARQGLELPEATVPAMQVGARTRADNRRPLT